jgi:AcrR family transcriptional regulator
MVVTQQPTGSGSTPEPDARTRRRRRFRDQAQDVALGLFTSRGYDEVTMAEIAASLDVSERTLFRYFPSKESLLDPAHEELVERLAAELAARPPDEHAFVAVREALRAVGDEIDHDRATFLARMSLVEAIPQLQAHLLRRQSELEDAIAEVVAARTGLDDPADLRPRLVAACAVSTLRVAVERWIASDTDDDLLTVLEGALDVLAGGLGDL